jgi:pyruvate/2-oxoglutarate dehydrogenase complex dihydrolipoamide dehydrogenase (E3) component
MSEQFDLIVLGSGSGARDGANKAATEHDARVDDARLALIESTRWGGSCPYKLVWDRESRRVVGLHVVSRNASDVVQGLALALKMGATVDDLAQMHHAFPTWGEGVKAAAEQALGS